MGPALDTDLYQLRMAASYLRRGITGTATFSLFVRNLPPERGFLVAAGLESCLDLLEAYRFDRDDLAHLPALGFTAADVAAFSRLRFTGDVWAVPEGTIVLAGEPLLEVTAPLPEAQLVETYLLNRVTTQTLFASKAARCLLAAGGRVQVVDFALRRTHGIEAAAAVARGAAIVGLAGTSNVAAAAATGLPAVGTMAHSYVEAFETEAAAFSAFAEDFPEGTTFLVDTYDTPTGVATAIEVIGRLGDALRGPTAIRLDSGDIAALAVDARRMLDAAGLAHVRIFASGGLDEHDLAAIVRAGAPIDGVGVGTRLGVSEDAPSLDSVYKLVEYGGRPVLKLSPGKLTLPGPKQVHRAPGFAGDLVALRDEAPPAGTRPLLVPVMEGGRRTGPAATLPDARRRFEHDLGELPEPARALDAPQSPLVRVSDRLQALAADLARSHRGHQPGGPPV